MSETSRIRPVTPADRVDWQQLYGRFLVSMERSMAPVARDRIFARLSEGDAIRGLLAVQANRPVGFAHYLVHANVAGTDVAYLQDLFTDEHVRGRGVGRALVEAVAQAARSRGCGRLYWHTSAANTTARRLYDAVAEHRGVIRYELDL